MGVVVVKFTDVIARVLKGIEIWAGGGATFGVGVTTPFVASPPAVGSRAPTSLSRGGCDRRIGAASSIPQGICGLHHGRGCRVVASSYCFTHGRGKANKEHGQKKIIVWVKHFFSPLYFYCLSNIVNISYYLIIVDRTFFILRRLIHHLRILSRYQTAQNADLRGNRSLHRAKHLPSIINYKLELK
jgi:hypothetical protein